MKKLASFETRGNFTDPEQQNRGIGAARRWIYDQFRATIRASKFRSILTR